MITNVWYDHRAACELKLTMIQVQLCRWTLQLKCFHEGINQWITAHSVEEAVLLTEDDVRDDEGEDEDGEEGEREDEHVEETVVPPSHAVPHPRTVVVKPLCVDRERVRKVYFKYMHGHLQVFPFIPPRCCHSDVSTSPQTGFRKKRFLRKMSRFCWLLFFLTRFLQCL